MAPPEALPRDRVRLLWPGGRSESARLLPLGKSGGAGEVFGLEGRPGHVAKVYHAAILAQHRERYERKIRWMVNHRPELPELPSGPEPVVQLAWPVAVVQCEGRFAGFAMEKIDFERTMEIDYLLTRRQAEEEGFAVDYGRLLTVCHNLATLLHCLHRQRIFVVDLKPVNLKVYKTELYVSILDCDGFWIDADGFVCEAPQVTPEYLAPEFHDRNVADPEAQDRFALATIVFRLLNYGIHPYAGVAQPGSPVPAELAGRIRAGYYPYGISPHRQIRATPASVHDCLPDALRALFDRSLGRGAQRVAAREWAQALAGYASRSGGMLERCEHGHLQFPEKPCATCVREGLLRGHLERQRRLLTRLQATPGRAARYVRSTLRGTHTSPFQAALAQGQVTAVQMTPQTASIRNTLSVEIVWVLGLAIAWWWLL